MILVLMNPPCQGHPPAQRRLGLCFQDGKGVATNLTKAVKYGTGAALAVVVVVVVVWYLKHWSPTCLMGVAVECR
jgi:glycerol-3-phosphate acyltransferase PlsY